MKIKVILTAVVGVALSVGTSQASLTSDTLANLVANHGTLSIADKTFSGFSFANSGLTSFDPTRIIVTASVDANGVDYLTWGGNMSFVSTSPGISTADLLLNYVVTASQGSINMIDQSYAGATTPGGFLLVTETVATGNFGGPIQATSQLTTTLNSQFVGPNLMVNPAQSQLWVTKDIAFALSQPGFVSVSQVSQSFHQTAVPEPSTIVAGALLLLPFGTSAFRSLRKGRVA